MSDLSGEVSGDSLSTLQQILAMAEPFLVQNVLHMKRLFSANFGHICDQYLWEKLGPCPVIKCAAVSIGIQEEAAQQISEG